MLKVYIFDDLRHFTDADLAAACEKLPAERREKARAYVQPIDRKQSAIAWLLLRHALRHGCRLPEVPEIISGYHGKPAFRQQGLPGFNISHCILAVACAVTDGGSEVGVDVEPYSSYGEDVAREVFNPEELQRVVGSPQAFAELWTKKESYLKYTGEGLTDSLKTLLSATGQARFLTFHAPAGYACTVCSQTHCHDAPVIVDKTTLLNG